MINIAVLGYGTVGSGVVEVLATNKHNISKKAGQEINVKYVLDIRDFEGDPIQEKIVHDYDTILNDEEVKVVVEVMGGLEPAYTFVKKALEKGKSVATSNKELVARHGAELLQIAKQKSINFMFEASVGGGIPIIRPLVNCLTADKIGEISGILNGTTNYMLTKMSEESSSYDVVLKDAQDKGYAERHPEADVEGHDACRKIAILTSLVHGNKVNFEHVYTEGITKIDTLDFQYAKALSASIKLVATSKKVNDKVYAMVSPVMIKSGHPLYSVSDVFNAVFINGNMLGDTMFYGKGAGKLPTASAVVSDVIEEVKNLNKNVMLNWDEEELSLGDYKELEHQFFVRASKTVAVDQVKQLFGEVQIVEVVENEWAFVTTTMSEQAFDKQVANIDGVVQMIRCNF